MIDKTILDQIIPVPTLEAARAEAIQELTDKGFAISDWRSGGVFYTLLSIVLWIKIELFIFLRKVLSNLFLKTAEETWLELKAADFNLARKAATKAQGLITLSRTETGEAVSVSAGTVFKTAAGADGKALRYLATADAVMAAGVASVQVPVMAEETGAAYNVAAGKITSCIIHLPTISGITNAAGWLTAEGSDEEDQEAFRRRCLGAWDSLAVGATAARYKAAAEAVEGVLFVTVDDDHPRGQGSVDVVVTSPTGTATPALLAAVEAALLPVTGNYDNVLVKSSTVTEQAITLTITMAGGVSQAGVADRAEASIREFMALPGDREVNKLYRADLIYLIKRDVPNAVNVSVITPATDVSLEIGQVGLPGAITITVQ